MLVVGLTGGIGAGKSSVAALLAERGAAIIDTDVIARAVVAPGEAAHEAVAERFSEELLDEHRSINRAALAGIVFSDAAALADLEAIVHPAVRQVVEARLAELADNTEIVVLEVPLLINEDGTPRYETDAILVVDVPEDLAVERLCAERGMTAVDARARISAQVSRTTRLRAADFVIVNMGTREELEAMVNGAWRWITGLSAAAQ